MTTCFISFRSSSPVLFVPVNYAYGNTMKGSSNSWAMAPRHKPTRRAIARGASPTKRLETKVERVVSSGTPPTPPRVNSTTIARRRPPTTPRGPPFTNTATNRPPTPSFIRPSSFVHLTGPGRQFRDAALGPGTRLAPWSGGGAGRLTGAPAPHDCRAADPSRP